MQRITAFALAAACLLAVAAPASAWGTGPWQDARATYYGLDAWSIHTGSCGYGFICPNRWSDELAEGQDVTAVSNVGPFYGHCGECLEVKCRPTTQLPDGSGGFLDRSEYCNNDVESVKVKIVDTCPCDYPGNYASNKRWCCGDFLHLDMSQWALEKLVNQIGQGVFGISVRTIDCLATIADPAPPLSTPLVDPHLNYGKGVNCATQSLGSPGSSGSDSAPVSSGSSSTPTAGPTASNARVARFAATTAAPTAAPSAAPTPAPTPKPVQASRKELTTESTTAQRATTSSTPTSAPTGGSSFSLNAITRAKTPGAVKMAVPWWHARQQQYLSQGSTDKSTGLPTQGSTANYWSAWWLNIFPGYSAEQKTNVYKSIWERITAGTLNVSQYGAPGGKK